MKNLLMALFIVLFLSACTSTHYSRVEGDTRVEVDHYSMGMDREGVDLSLSKTPDNVNVGVKVGKSSGEESFDAAADALIDAAKALKGI
jgi:hypothetical protein